MFRSTKPPAAIGTLPVAVQLEFEAAEQAREVLVILPGAPCRSVTVMVADCWEYTVSDVAVQPEGTQVNTDAFSLELAAVLFTE
jgi:hypothetical protein